MRSHDLSGTWHNENGSEINVEEGPEGKLSGRFRSGVGLGTDEQFELSGYTAGSLLSFTVNFGAHGSLTAWVGHRVGEELQTMWQMTLELPHPNRSGDLWRAVWSGANTFRRGPAPRMAAEGRRPSPPPLWPA